MLLKGEGPESPKSEGIYLEKRIASLNGKKDSCGLAVCRFALLCICDYH